MDSRLYIQNPNYPLPLITENGSTFENLIDAYTSKNSYKIKTFKNIVQEKLAATTSINDPSKTSYFKVKVTEVIEQNKHSVSHLKCLQEFSKKLHSESILSEDYQTVNPEVLQLKKEPSHTISGSISKLTKRDYFYLHQLAQIPTATALNPEKLHARSSKFTNSEIFLLQKIIKQNPHISYEKISRVFNSLIKDKTINSWTISLMCSKGILIGPTKKLNSIKVSRDTSKISNDDIILIQEIISEFKHYNIYKITSKFNLLTGKNIKGTQVSQLLKNGVLNGYIKKNWGRQNFIMYEFRDNEYLLIKKLLLETKNSSLIDIVKEFEKTTGLDNKLKQIQLYIKKGVLPKPNQTQDTF